MKGGGLFGQPEARLSQKGVSIDDQKGDFVEEQKLASLNDQKRDPTDDQTEDYKQTKGSLYTRYLINLFS